MVELKSHALVLLQAVVGDNALQCPVQRVVLLSNNNLITHLIFFELTIAVINWRMPQHTRCPIVGLTGILDTGNKAFLVYPVTSDIRSRSNDIFTVGHPHS